MPPETIDARHFSSDIREFIRLLDMHGVRYVIVGGEAVIFYGYARLTGDVDFFYAAEPDNARDLFGALEEFWSGTIPGIAGWEELLEEGIVVQFGRPPHRIDLLNRIDGVTFADAWATRRVIEMVCETPAQRVPLNFLSLPNLIKNKAAAARPKDLDDLQYLQAASDNPENLRNE